MRSSCKKRYKKADSESHGVVLFRNGTLFLSLLTFFMPAIAGDLNQTDWSGGPSTSNAVHPGNETGWTLYSSKDVGVGATIDLELVPATDSMTQTANADFAEASSTFYHTTYSDFTSGSPTLNNVKINNGAIGILPSSIVNNWTRKAGNTWDFTNTGEAKNVPAFADLDGDGDMDMLIGQEDGNTEGFRNIGSDESPSWESYPTWRVDRFFEGVWRSNAAPILGDFDNDGDTDLFLGFGAKMFSLENIGNKELAVWARNSAWDLDVSAIVGAVAGGSLVDLNGNGQLDIMVGGGWSKRGVYAYEFTGGAWTRRADWDPELHNTTNGYSTNQDVGKPSLADLDGDGDQDMLVGWRYNQMLTGYENSNGGSPTWTAQATNFYQDISDIAEVTSYHSPGLIDLDSDGDYDFLVGGASSAILYGYENSSTVYNTSGSYISEVLDTAGANAGFTTVVFSVVEVGGTNDVKIDLRAGNVVVPDASWTEWQTDVASGSDMNAALGNRRYVQYRVNLSTIDTSQTPLFKDITINYTAYPAVSNTVVAHDKVALALSSRTLAWENDPDKGTNPGPWTLSLTTSAHGPDTNFNNSKPVLGDLDGDGHLDLLLGDDWTGSAIGGYKHDGVNTWTYQSAWNVTGRSGNTYSGMADIDGDGDQDAFVNNGTSVQAYRNDGGVSSPSWVANASWDIAHGLSGANVDFADLDNDGDLDAMVSHVGGPHEVFGYENTTSDVSTGPVWVAKPGWNYILADSNEWTKVPRMVDIDGDSDYDMFVGDSDGSYSVAENVGNQEVAVWGHAPSWEPPAITTPSGQSAYSEFVDFDDDGDYDLLRGGSGAYAIISRYNQSTSTYPASGTYHSGVLDFGAATFTTLTYNVNVRTGTSLTIDLRGGDTPNPEDGSWTTWSTSLASGADISSFTGNRYLQYRVNMSSNGGNTLTPELLDISVNYTGLVSPSELISSAYDSSTNPNYLTGIAWQELLVANSDIRLQVRTAPDAASLPGTWSTWVGPDGTSASYWNSSNTYNGNCTGSGSISCSLMPSAVRDGTDDQWFQYKVILVADDVTTPTFYNVTVSYAPSLPPGVTVTPNTGLVTTEALGIDTFDVVLDAAPASSSVTIPVSSSDSSEGAPSTSLLTFTTGNWNVPQTVTVTGVNDDVDDGEISYSIVLGAASGDANYAGIDPVDVLVTNIDDDIAGISVSPTSGLVTTEATLGTDTFDIVLDSEPTADVTINLTSSDTSEGTVSPSSVTFTSANWNSPQAITVTAVDEGIDDGDIAYIIETANAISADGKYYNMNAQDVAVTNIDDDTVGLSIDVTSGLVTSEAGGTTSFTITMDSEPVSQVIIGIYSSNLGEGTVAPTQLTFNDSNWQTPQTVVITGIDDALLDGDVGYTIVTSATASLDPAYNDWNLPDVTVTNTDNDSAGVTITPTSGLTTTEAGGQATFHVVLNTIPSNYVYVHLELSDPSEGSLSTSMLEFHSGTWMTPLVVTVTGVDDLINDDDILYSVITTVSSTDPDYASVNPADVSLTNTDDDSGGAPADGFSQIDWGDGLLLNSPTCSSVGGTWTGNECVAVDPSNQSGWAAYSSKDTNLSITNAGADLQLMTVARSITHTSDTDFSPATSSVKHTTFSDFSAGDTSGNSKVNNGAIGIKPSTLTNAWTYNSGWNYTSGGGTDAPAYGDLDGDGDLDMLIGFGSGHTEGYRNIGSDESPLWEDYPAWRVDRYFDAQWMSTAVPTLGDFDNDGDLDLFMGFNGNMIYGLENTGGKYAVQWTRKTAWDLTNVAGAASRGLLVDLNGDGQLDMMAGGGWSVPNLYAFEYNTSTETWSRNTAWEPLAHTTSNGYPSNQDLGRAAAGDLDDDGDLDMVTGWRYRDDAVGYENTGNALSPIWTNNFNQAVVAGDYHTPALVDYDSDGDLDIMKGSSAGLTIYAYENTGTVYNTSGTYLSAIIDTGSHSGLNILSYTSYLPANTAITVDIRGGDVAAPDGSWTTWMTGIANGADISGLGNPRYVQYRVNLSTSDTAVTPRLNNIEISYFAYPLADNVVLAEGTLTLEATSSSITWTAEASWNLDASSGSPDGNNANAVAALGDIDGDGDLDILRGDNWESEIGFYINNGSNVWTYNSAFNLYCCTGQRGLPRLVDMDGDGDLDVMLGSGTEIQAFENIGTATSPAWQAGAPATQNNAWKISHGASPAAADFADLDGDGDYDALVGDSSGNVFAYENRGTSSMPSWIRNSAWDANSSASSIFNSRPNLTDLDGDGDIDLIIGDDGDGQSFAYENVGTTSGPIWGRKTPWDPADIGGDSTIDFADLDNDGDIDMLFGDDSDVIKGYRNTGTTTYAFSGSYTSSALDAGAHLGFTTLDYTVNIRTGTALTVDVRAGNVAIPDGTWTAWQTGITDGGDISVLGTNRYVQYRVNFTANGGNALAPDFDDISINYNSIGLSAKLISTSFDTTSATNFISDLSWTESLTAGTSVQIQMRIAADNAGEPGVWSDWVGPDGSSDSYWDSVNTYTGGCSGTGSITCTTVPSILKNGANAQWFQYKVTLVSNGLNTPTFSDIGISYSDGTASGLVSVTPTSGITTTEALATDTFDVVLTSPPAADVVIQLESSDLSEATLSTATLTFTNGNWNTPQTVTLTGVNDTYNDGDVNYTVYTSVTSSSDASFDKLIVSDVTATNTDDDAGGAGITVTPTNGLTTTEAGGQDTFSIVLTGAPSDDVIITLASDDNTEGTVSPNVMTFTTGDWSIPQVATITGIDDIVFDQNINYNIVTNAAASADPNYNGMPVPDISVTNTNDDLADIVVTTSGGLTTSESGGVDVFQVRLASEPTANVTFYLSSSDSTEGVVLPFYMTFTPADWNVDQPGTVFGANDSVIDGNVVFNIATSTFTSADPNFSGQNPQDIPVTNSDDDGYTITVNPPSGLLTSENGETAVFQIKLGTRPTADVVIPLTSSDPSEANVPSQVIIPPDDIAWRGTTIFVTGVDDQIVDDDQPFTIVTGAASSADLNYNTIDADNVTGTNLNYNTLTHGHGVAAANLGQSVAIIGDVNGDGFADAAVGAPNYQKDFANEGRVDIYYGPMSTWGAIPALSFYGGATSAYFGYSVSAAGDVNNDGYDDLVVGAYGASTGGVVYVYHGSSSGFGASPDTTIDLNQASANFGYAVAGAGNVNGDSYADIIVGAPGQDKAYLYHGSASGVVTTPSQTLVGSQGGSQFGISVASAGDLDNDNYSDIIVGADLYDDGNTDEGAAFIYFGSASGTLATADWVYQPDQDGANFGRAIAGPGDLNGDSYDDLIIGAPNYDNGHTNEGRVFVYYGGERGVTPAIGLLLEPNQDSAFFGSALSGATDYNKDGYADVIIGAPGYSNGEAAEGRAYVYLGSAAGLTTNGQTYESDQASANYGVSVSGGGDFDNDGFGDVVVGANLFDGTVADEGYVFFQRTPPSLVKVTVTPTSGLVVGEDGTYATFNIVLESPPTDDVTVWFSSGDTTEGTVTAFTVFSTINWNVPRTIYVLGVDDNITDGNVEFYIVSNVVSDDTTFNGAPVDAISVTNINDDTSVFIAATDSNVGETGNNTAEFTFTRVGPTDSALVVNYSVTGTAVNGTDFTGAGGSLTILSGQTTGTVTITPVDDAIIESAETVSLNVLATSNYSIGSGGTASVTIVDNDAAGITVSPTSGLVTSEAGGMASFTVVLNTQPAASQSVVIDLSSDDTSEGVVSPSSLTFTDSNWNTPQTVSVIGQDDITVDGSISYNIVTAAAVSGDGLYNGLNADDVAVSNTDDDSLPNVSIATTISVVDELSSQNGIFELSRTGSTAADLTVHYTVNGTATDGIDFVTIGASIVIPAGSSSVSLPVTSIDDGLPEGDEVVIVTLVNDANYVITQAAESTVTIRDDDAPEAPYANFSLDQFAGEGGSATVVVALSETPIAYPVTIPYTISGTASNPADHNAASGDIVINSGREGSVVVNIATDGGAGDPNETVIFTMGSPSNAQVGARSTHTITIIEDNEDPRVTFTPKQNVGGFDIETSLIITNEGNVTITANADDPNPGDSHNYDWSGTNDTIELLDVNDFNDATLVFDPSSVSPGFYKVRVTVTDNGVSPNPISVDLLLEVALAAPVLTDADTDKDGLTDSSESYDDSDGDGIADYKDDSRLQSNELQLDTTLFDSYIMQTEVGLTLKLGDVALAAGADGALVTDDEIANYGDGEGGAGTNPYDTEIGTGSYFDFEITGLPKAGQLVRIVIPEQHPLPAGAAYRKYDGAGWSDFVIDGSNTVGSAPGLPGECPPPGDSAYIAGLTEGHYCIQLTIEDGGPNDMDGMANHVIEDPAQIAVSESETNTVLSLPSSSTSSNGGGGGAICLIWLFVLGVYRTLGIRKFSFHTP